MQDKIITCVQCNESFVFKAEEMERFRALGFDEPSRCPACRKKKNKGSKSEGPWKDKGRKKRSKRKDKGGVDDDI